MQTDSDRISPEEATEAISNLLLSNKTTSDKKLSVLAMYSMYLILARGSKRYAKKTLMLSESRAKSVGDIEVKNPDGSYLEAIAIKQNKPITAAMIGAAYRKIKNTDIKRYYILTTHEPDSYDSEAVAREIEKYSKVHPCEIIADGVIPSLKYYMRLMNNPQAFVDEYTKWLELEFQRASGIKRKHLRVWQEIRQKLLEEN